MMGRKNWLCVCGISEPKRTARPSMRQCKTKEAWGGFPDGLAATYGPDLAIADLKLAPAQAGVAVRAPHV